MKRVTIVILLLLLVGCFDSSSPDWQLTNTGLSYQNVAVDFNAQTLANCRDCRLKNTSQHSPQGPVKFTGLYQKDALVAAYGENAQLEVKIPNDAGRTVFKVLAKNNAWQLESESNSYVLSEGEVTNVTVYGTNYVILPLKLSKQRINYIWLKQ